MPQHNDGIMKSLDEILKMGDPSEYLYEYAEENRRLKPKWEELLLLLGDPHWLYLYTKNIIKGRWLEAEEYIKKSPARAYWYIKDVIKDRLEEAEETIKKDPYWAYWYARNIIKGRWGEAEEIIKKDSEHAYWYARYVIKDRWPEAEEYIKKGKFWWQSYYKHFNIKE